MRALPCPSCAPRLTSTHFDRYTSFRALVYYLYTDSITFSPLASNYHTARELALLEDAPFPFPTRRSYLLANSAPAAHTITASLSPGTPGPCSAKAVCPFPTARAAGADWDRLDLPPGGQDRPPGAQGSSVRPHRQESHRAERSNSFLLYTRAPSLTPARRSRMRSSGPSRSGSRRSSVSRLRFCSNAGYPTSSRLSCRSTSLTRRTRRTRSASRRASRRSSSSDSCA